ncbi:MAG: DUF5623 domain-containing protein [Gammaproteobacteria bacterium]|nr:DUF5623 domain-containing protein [Gammaproteobacteria bacterium]MBU1504508.1 DUF5623 domain-containing protein [Gammaproteobacteria bacterium]MBU2118890.1 DUF5623 domain-containing protein [Gammaproteobacteria bacterium]MBU2202863.1 DUF5623 domain-containing protein [Gammaproteobacteria bacterium]MBU2272602.1 DUF5623 domain-containing protein [Gammaproteobacteria bacterium]
MLNTPPSTVDGLKRHSKKLSKSLGIPLHQAQAQAAVFCGYPTFAVALKSLSAKQPVGSAPTRKHRLHVSAWWTDRETRQSGREVWWVDLSAPYTQLLTPSQMRLPGAFARLTPLAKDHLFIDYRHDSQERAQHHICHALRTWLFVDATKLRPSTTHSRVYPEGKSSNAIPGRDHYSGWYDPITKGYVFVDEPYEPAALRKAADRAQWSNQHQYDIAKPQWPGMYLPGGQSGSRLYLVASKKNGPPLAPLVKSLDKLPAPPVSEAWKGDSAQGLSHFVSPGETDAQGNKPEPPKTPTAPPPAHRGKQPNRMPIETHEVLGKLLKDVNADTYMREGVRNRMATLRGTLDSWIQNEYSVNELPFERFTEVYFGDTPRTRFEKSLPLHQREAHMATLADVKQTLEQHYTPTKVRALTNRIDQMMKSLSTWK